jgi:hypothetical protein
MVTSPTSHVNSPQLFYVLFFALRSLLHFSVLSSHACIHPYDLRYPCSYLHVCLRSPQSYARICLLYDVHSLATTLYQSCSAQFSLLFSVSSRKPVTASASDDSIWAPGLCVVHHFVLYPRACNGRKNLATHQAKCLTRSTNDQYTNDRSTNYQHIHDRSTNYRFL